MAKYSISYVYELVDKYSRNADKIAKSTDNITRKKRKALVAVERFKRGLKASAREAMKSKLAFAALGAAILLLGRNAFNTFLGFENSMNRVSAVTLATEDQLKKMSRLSKELGSTTAFTAAQSADALIFLSQAGLSVEQAMNALPNTLQLAAAGNIDLAEAADIATNVLAQMGLEVAELGRVNDVLAKSQSISNTDIRQLAGALNTTGQTAASMGIEIELLAASLGTMANAGLKAENAGTLFRNMILKTAIGAKKHGKVYKSLGIDMDKFLDKTGKFKDFKGFVGALQNVEKTGKLTIPILNKLFGERGFRAAQVLIGAGAENIAEFEQSLKRAGGTAKEMSDRQMAGLVGSTKRFTSAWEGLNVAIMDDTMFSRLIGNVIDAGAWLAATVAPTGNFSKSLGDLGRAAGEAFAPLSTLIAVLVKGSVFDGISSVFRVLTTGIRAFTSGLLISIRLVETLGIAIGALATGASFSEIGNLIKSIASDTGSDLADIWGDTNPAAQGAAANKGADGKSGEILVSSKDGTPFETRGGAVPALGSTIASTGM